MVTADQIAHNCDELVEVLSRSGYETTDMTALRKRARNVRSWLDRFAPPFVKFEVQRTLPVQVKTLTPGQRKALEMLAKALETDNSDPEWLHNEVYNISEQVGIHSKEAFKAIYISLLAKTSGPRAGWFLVTLDPEFFIARFREAAGDVS
jgi:lysyl-tRNA synthetase class 1